MTTVVISQPMLFPWAGFFELLSHADVYVHLDDVQLPDKSFINRVQIKQAAGPAWMTIPIVGRTDRQPINEVVAASGPWRRRHRELLRHSLAKAPHLSDALALLDRSYAKERVVDILMDSIEASAAYLGLGPKTIVRSSALGVGSKGSQRILDLVLRVGGTRYVTGHGAANYLDHEALERSGIAVDYADYSKTAYPQQHGEFTPYVSVLDPIANLGTLARSVLAPTTVPWRQFVASYGRTLDDSVG